MGLLARRNLFHDKMRFAVTLTGIVFALVLIIIQFGLFLGFTTTTSNNKQIRTIGPTFIPAR